MIISGDSFRSISDQTGVVEFNFSVENSTATGRAVVGISGISGLMGFTFQNRKVYDPQNKFIGSYEIGIPSVVSGQVGQSSYDYYLDNQLIALGEPWTPNVYNYIFCTSSDSVDVHTNIKGELPGVSYNLTGKYYNPNYTVRGNIVNHSSLKFRIFDVQINQPNSPFSVVGFPTGDIGISGYIDLYSSQTGLSDIIIPIKVSTNYGTVNATFFVSGDYSVIPDLYLNVSPNPESVLSSTTNDYTIEFQNIPSGDSLQISLEYLSGITGNIYFFEQTGVTKSQFVSGFITGQGMLSVLATGTVSGLDPKTLIVETGFGSGILSTQNFVSTGFVSQNYNIPVYGLGQGLFQTNYEASGTGIGFYNGAVSISGGFLPVIGYNFSGSGDNPGVATGLIPSGSGVAFVYPTGCWGLAAPLINGIDFVVANISAPYAYSGPLSYNYSVLAVGYATGNNISGKVDSNFARKFEPGFYHFSRQFSGVAFSKGLNTGIFNPTGCLVYVDTSGVLTGNFTLDSNIDCINLTGLPQIPITGYPSLVLDSNLNVFSPNTVVPIKPIAGYASNETSFDLLTGANIRTRTSRVGITPSGSGFFQNPIADCLDVGSVGNPVTQTTHLWKETVAATATSGEFDSPNNGLGKVSTQMYLQGGAQFNGSSNTFTGASPDSGVIYFSVSGSGTKTMAFRSLNFESFSSYDRTFEFYLFKNGFPTHVWGATNNDFEYTDAWNKWRSVVSKDTSLNDGVIVLDDLSSGLYALYVVSTPVVPPVVYFQSDYFSGCENSKNLVITVCASGNITEPIWFELTQYEDVTARSGVNYDPTFLVYTPDNIAKTGQQFYNYGGFFSPDATGDANGVKSYQFTVPVYDNAHFGNDATFNIYLSNVSGASIGRQQATVVITDNDTTGFAYNPYNMTGSLPVTSSTGLPLVISGKTFYPTFSGFQTWQLSKTDCSYVPPITPPYPNLSQPPKFAGLSPGDGCKSKCFQPCCQCGNVTTITGNCPGRSELFSGQVVTPGQYCGTVSAAGCGSTDGAMFIGRVCAGLGSSYIDIISSGCAITAFVYPEDSFLKSDDDPTKLLCPENGGCAPAGVSWSGCSNGLCSGNCSTGVGTGVPCEVVGSFNSINYANHKGKPQPGPKCSNLVVFLSVTCHDTSSDIDGHHHCLPWAYQGGTIPAGGHPQSILCPPSNL